MVAFRVFGVVVVLREGRVENEVKEEEEEMIPLGRSEMGGGMGVVSRGGEGGLRGDERRIRFTITPMGGGRGGGVGATTAGEISSEAVRSRDEEEGSVEDDARAVAEEVDGMVSPVIETADGDGSGGGVASAGKSTT